VSGRWDWPPFGTSGTVFGRRWPGAKGLKDCELLEEWYALKNFAPDLHVILVQETEAMKGDMYRRPSYPATWARREDKGRVFYTSLGHREDVWQNPLFHELLGGLSWAAGNVPHADLAVNLEKAAARAGELPEKKEEKNEDKKDKK
jgi:type 1 glutamine amidotransferase